MLLTRDYIEGLLTTDLPAWFSVHVGIIPDDVVAEFWAIVARSEPNADVEKALCITYKAGKLDLSKVPLACQCLRCTEKADADDACLYLGIGSASRGLANLDPHLVAEFWDLPYTLYALAQLKSAYKIRGELAAKYCAEEADEEPGKTKAERLASASLHQLRRNNG
jgi:hypothetical protein